MPTRAAEPHHCSQVVAFFREQGIEHLRARKHGVAVIIESGPEGDAIKHVRLRRDAVHIWALDIADHRGKWERTPFRGGLEDALALVLDSFPWVLEPGA